MSAKTCGHSGLRNGQFWHLKHLDGPDVLYASTLKLMKNRACRLNISLLVGVLGRTTMNIGSLRPSFTNCLTWMTVKPNSVSSFLTFSSVKEIGIPLSNTFSDRSSWSARV